MKLVAKGKYDKLVRFYIELNLRLLICENVLDVLTTEDPLIGHNIGLLLCPSFILHSIVLIFPLFISSYCIPHSFFVILFSSFYGF